MKKLITLSILVLFCQISSFACTIYGTLGLCTSSSTYLNVDSSCSGGTWTSSNTLIATVASYGMYGYVTGVSAGMATISYTTLLGTTTAVVTVSAAPAPITGTSSFCVGTYSTFTDATSGGIWTSGATGVATINPTTGVAYGVAGGFATISYTVGGGCPATKSITVNSTTLYDSLSGPSSVCAGSSVTITSTISGGTWTSSNTAIATVGSSTGIVTGVSTGMAYITYSVASTCGIAYDYTTIYVNPTVTAGPIYGTLSANVGATSTLTDYTYGGTWLSFDPSIATISTSGVVTGVSAGSVEILYIVNGCVSSDTAFATFTVTTLDGISGNVMFSSTFYGYVKVWLITFNTSTLDLEAADSSMVYCGGTSAYYNFSGLPTDSFRVKAATVDSMGLSTGYVPTYHDSSLHWNIANVIPHVSGTADINKNIYMRSGTTTSGPGFISGFVYAGADKGTSGSVPVAGMLVYVVNSTTGVELQKIYTDITGYYSFSNLPVGETYYIYPEAINYATTPYVSITLTSTTPSMTIANFKQHTISKTITPLPTSVSNVSVSESGVTVYPNPTTGLVNLNWNLQKEEKASITFSDITGRELLQKSIIVNKGKDNTVLDLSSIPNGLYIISVKSETINYKGEVSIMK